jgi:hypothetical protein
VRVCPFLTLLLHYHDMACVAVYCTPMCCVSCTRMCCVCFSTALHYTCSTDALHYITLPTVHIHQARMRLRVCPISALYIEVLPIWPLFTLYCALNYTRRRQSITLLTVLTLLYCIALQTNYIRCSGCI